VLFGVQKCEVVFVGLVIQGSRNLLRPLVDASQHHKLQCSCTSSKITGLITRVFLGRIKSGPLKCTDPTVHYRESPRKDPFVPTDYLSTD
jgi:hypothetical protein